MTFSLRSCSNCEFSGVVETTDILLDQREQTEIEYWTCGECGWSNEIRTFIGPDPDDQRDLLREMREDAR